MIQLTEYNYEIKTDKENSLDMCRTDITKESVIYQNKQINVFTLDINFDA